MVDQRKSSNLLAKNRPGFRRELHDFPGGSVISQRPNRDDDPGRTWWHGDGGRRLRGFLSTLAGLQDVTVSCSGTTLTIVNNSGSARSGELVTFEINSLIDTVVEPNESFTTQISAPSLCLVGAGSVTTTITNIDNVVNSPPVAIDDLITVTEDTDLDGDALTAVPGTFATAAGPSAIAGVTLPINHFQPGLLEASAFYDLTSNTWRRGAQPDQGTASHET